MDCNHIQILRRDGSCYRHCNGGCPSENNTSPLMAFCDKTECPAITKPCCTGISPDKNAGEEKDIYAYVTQVIDTETVQGSLLNEMLRLTPQNSNFVAEFTDCNGCSCSQPVLDGDSEFRVLSSEVELNTVFLAEPLSACAFLLNQYTPDDIISKNKNGYEIALDSFNSRIYHDGCTQDGKNSAASLMVAPKGIPVSYQASFVLCGTVTSHSGTYGFKFIVRMDDPVTSYHCTSFILPRICLPVADGSGNARLTINFSFDGQLVAPNLAINCDNQLVFTAALSITPTMSAETVMDKKVILNIREEDCE